MRQTMAWWRNLGGLVAACVLALLVITPTVCMATCLCEEAAPIVSVEAGAGTAHAIQSAPQDHNAPCEAVCCANGHCHHGGAMLDAPVAAAPAPAPVASEHVMIAAHALASRTISSLDRPPRA